MSAASSTIYLVLREGDLAELLDRQRAGPQVVVWNDVGSWLHRQHREGLAAAAHQSGRLMVVPQSPMKPVISKTAALS
ncbi:hypothetical protein [Rhizobium leguminosarum]|uniref:hypothetical protein n=1 Tax=Rhizobium leguminosarum TaxID=384 RepID=UPI0013D90B9A|nr:hypothetical protein [Rhizobium leguminosarum]